MVPWKPLFYHYFATFCMFLLSLLTGMEVRFVRLVLTAHWIYTAPKRGGGIERVCLCCGTWSWLSPQAPSLWETGVTEWGHVCILLLEPLGSEYLLYMTLPMCTKTQGWLWARSVMSVCFIKGQADHFCPALTLRRFIKQSLRSLSPDRKFVPKVSLMPNTTW